MDKSKKRLNELEENAFCFIHLITDYMNDAITGRNVLIPLEKHLNTCRKCAKEWELQKKFSENLKESEKLNDNTDLEYLPAFAAFKQEFDQVTQQQEKHPNIIKEGQIWSTPGFPNYLMYQYGITDKELPYSLEPRPFLVYRLDSETDLAFGFPINSNYLEFASNFDLIVSEDETELGFEFMVEIWNQMSTDKESLQKCWGTVPEEILKKVKALALEFNGFEVQGEIPENIITGKPIHFENDIRYQFQQLEHRITEYISAPLIEKEEFEEFKHHYVTHKILETMIISSVVYMNRHKDFLRIAGDKNGTDEDKIFIYSKKQLIFDEQFTLEILINEMKTEYLLQLNITDNEAGEETRSFIVDIIEWEGEIPESEENLKITYLLFKKNGEKIKHIRLWEEEKRLPIPTDKNIILGIYKPSNKERIECIPIDLISK